MFFLQAIRTVNSDLTRAPPLLTPMHITWYIFMLPCCYVLVNMPFAVYLLAVYLPICYLLIFIIPKNTNKIILLHILLGIATFSFHFISCMWQLNSVFLQWENNETEKNIEMLFWIWILFIVILTGCPLGPISPFLPWSPVLPSSPLIPGAPRSPARPGSPWIHTTCIRKSQIQV